MVERGKMCAWRPELLEREFERGVFEASLQIREGRFQRGLALIAGIPSLLSGLEVTYEHFRGSCSHRIMCTPVILRASLLAGGVLAFKSRKAAAKTVLPVVSILTLADCATGFYFHVHGIHRKPGSWRLPIVNMIMGPPVFASLLFGMSAYYLRRSGDLAENHVPRPAQPRHWGKLITGGEHEEISWEQDPRERFQKHMAATIMAAFSAASRHGTRTTRTISKYDRTHGGLPDLARGSDPWFR